MNFSFFFCSVTMQAQREVPPDMQCKDKFLLQCVIANPGTTAKDITPEMVDFDSSLDVVFFCLWKD